MAEKCRVFMVHNSPKSVLSFRVRNSLYVNADYYQDDLIYRDGEMFQKEDNGQAVGAVLDYLTDALERNCLAQDSSYWGGVITTIQALEREGLLQGDVSEKINAIVYEKLERGE